MSWCGRKKTRVNPGKEPRDTGNQPRITRITPNGRVKNPLMRPFGVIRVIRGYFPCLSVRTSRVQQSDRIKGVVDEHRALLLIELNRRLAEKQEVCRCD